MIKLQEAFTLFNDVTVYFSLFQTGYSVVAACVVSLRWKDKAGGRLSSSTWREGVICLFLVALGGFGAGLSYRLNSSFIYALLTLAIAVLACIALLLRQVSTNLYFDKPSILVENSIIFSASFFLFLSLWEPQNAGRPFLRGSSPLIF